MEDLIEQANEIQESLGRSYGIPDELDEADLEAGGCQNVCLALTTELDALGLDDELIGENETPSYLQESTALPDFVDAAPVEEEVSYETALELTADDKAGRGRALVDCNRLITCTLVSMALRGSCPSKFSSRT